jgi:hypothetical protein
MALIFNPLSQTPTSSRINMLGVMQVYYFARSLANEARIDSDMGSIL